LCAVSDGLHIPAYSDLLWPTLRAVQEIGDSGTNEEIVEKVLINEGFSEEQLAVPANNGRSG
jgi:restriction system protein